MSGSRTAAELSGLRRILVPVDFSRSSECALRRAAYLGARAHAEVHLLHVLPAEAAATDRRSAERALSRASALLGRAARSAGGAITVTSRVRLGEPHVHIIRHAREIDAELVIAGRGRRTGAVGTTAGRLVHLSAVATLLVARRPGGPYRRPLVAVEIDPSARDLLELACRVVGDPQVPLRIVHAYQLPFMRLHRLAGDDNIGHYSRVERNDAGRELERMLSRVKSPCEVKAVVRRGEPRAVIAREAVRHNADLVAVGTHGRSGVAYVLLGSIAESVVANTVRDVLVARPARFTFVPP